MKISAFFVILISVIMLCAFVDAACAADFKADVVNTSPQGAVEAKMYVSGEKSRFEMRGAINIARMDQKVNWMLMPSQKMYLEQPLDSRTVVSTQEKVAGEVERKAEGKETVSGIATTKYRVTFETGGRRESIFQWMDETNSLPVKTAAIDGSWSSEFKNIVVGPQDPSLFEIPPGYKKMEFKMPDLSSMMQGAQE